MCFWGISILFFLLPFWFAKSLSPSIYILSMLLDGTVNGTVMLVQMLDAGFYTCVLFFNSVWEQCAVAAFFFVSLFSHFILTCTPDYDQLSILLLCCLAINEYIRYTFLMKATHLWICLDLAAVQCIQINSQQLSFAHSLTHIIQYACPLACLIIPSLGHCLPLYSVI